MTTVKNWAGTFRFQPRRIFTPSSEADILDCIDQAKRENSTMRIMGSRHSWTELIRTHDFLLSLDDYQGIDGVDHESSTATVKGGTKLNFLGEELYERQVALENLGDIDRQSIAGTLSTGTHGTGVEFGTISTQIVELTLATAKGELLTCSETENPNLFRAAQLSLGALGILTKIKLHVVPVYKLKAEIRPGRLEETLEVLDTHKKENRNFEFFWFPYSERVMLKFLNETCEPIQTGGTRRVYDDIVMANGAFYLLSHIARLFPSSSKSISRLSGVAISNQVFVDYSHRVYATARWVKFTEMEYNIPAEHFVAAIHEIRSCIEKSQFNVHFPIECRFVKADNILISPANGRDSAYIAVHMFKGMPYRAYFDAIEKILQRYHGRPHYGKMHGMTHEQLAGVYPQWETFKEIRREMDPDGLFLNGYLRRLLGLGGVQ